MVQSVELLLDDATDAAIRGGWAALIEADLPSSGRHQGASNAPHITLAVAGSMSAEQEHGVERVAADLTWPFSVHLGGVVVFGRGPFVLARLVVPSADLLDRQAAVAAVLGDSRDDRPWTPHITLARRVAGADLGRAIELVAAPEVEASATAVRRWNSEQKQEWIIAQSGAPR